MIFQFLGTVARVAGEVATDGRDAERALKDLVEHGLQLSLEASDNAADDARAHLPDDQQPETD